MQQQRKFSCLRTFHYAIEELLPDFYLEGSDSYSEDMNWYNFCLLPSKTGIFSIICTILVSGSNSFSEKKQRNFLIYQNTCNTDEVIWEGNLTPRKVFNSYYKWHSIILNLIKMQGNPWHKNWHNILDFVYWLENFTNGASSWVSGFKQMFLKILVF